MSLRTRTFGVGILREDPTRALGQAGERGGACALVPRRPQTSGSPLCFLPQEGARSKGSRTTPRGRGGLFPGGRGSSPVTGAAWHSAALRRGPPPRSRCEAGARGEPGLAPSVPRRGQCRALGAAPALPGRLTRDKSGPRRGVGVDGAFHGCLSSGIKWDRNLWNASPDLCVRAARRRFAASRPPHTLSSPIPCWRGRWAGRQQSRARVCSGTAAVDCLASCSVY